ncbi:MAG: ferrochelatase [Nitrospirae bacterium]|nr:ferrochelatase [Nitrospirota bacterium]
MRSTGVLLLNLGGPDSLKAVRPFLYNLFSDRLIIKLGPAFLQRPLAALIALMRSPKTRRMYKLIGGASPIRELTSVQAKALQARLDSECTPDGCNNIKVYVGMRYWRPFIEDAIKEAYTDGVHRLIALSLYPHYSLATAGSAFTELERVLKAYPMKCEYIRNWPQNSFYVEALAGSIRDTIDEDCDGVDSGNCHILMSAHGLPVYFIKNGDPYLDELNKTIESVKKRLPNLTYHLSFQSRSGPVKWLTPSTEDMIRQLAKQGVRRLVIVPISFVSDHIETLYEIDILYKDFALKRGIILKRVKPLNDNPLFIEALKSLVEKTLVDNANDR